MVQVVTNENMQEFIAKREVPAFVAPKVEVKPVEKTAEAVATEGKQEQARAEDGKFVKAEAKTEEKSSEAAKTAVDDEDADLPERVKRIIGKKHRGMKEAEEFARERDRQAAVAEAQVEELKRQLQEFAKSGPAQDGKSQAKADGAPNPEDFKTVAEYADALVEFKLTKRLAEREQEQTQKQQQQAADQVKSAFIERLEKARETITDYDDVVGAVDTQIPPHMAQYVMESDLGPLLGYHLAKHPEEIQRLVKLSPIRAIAELGKLEASLEKKPEVRPAVIPAVSKAPSPIEPLDGGSATVNKDPAKMTLQELREFRRTEDAKRARR
ncbi:MAG TPA: hypothetical protein VLL06_02730 [Nitrospiraceae bacterium]|nr:hypothetical protein [Nitrospiraceae bacterium]